MNRRIATVLLLASIATHTQASGVSSTPEGVVDQESGLAWKEFTSLSDGQALGFRLATDLEFQTLVTHAGLNPGNWTDTFASQFYIGAPTVIYSGAGSTALIDISNQTATKSPLAVAPGFVIGSWLTQDLGLVANTRDLESAFMLAGVSESTGISSGCQAIGSTSPEGTCAVTVTSALLDRPRLIGQVSSTSITIDEASSTYKSYLSFLGYQTAADLAYSTPSTLGYYMVQSVPEPGSMGLMALGLVALLGMRGRQAQQATNAHTPK